MGSFISVVEVVAFVCWLLLQFVSKSLEFIWWILTKIPYGFIFCWLWETVGWFIGGVFELLFGLLSNVFALLFGSGGSAGSAPTLASAVADSAPTKAASATLFGQIYWLLKFTLLSLWWAFSWGLVVASAIFSIYVGSEVIHAVFPPMRPKYSAPLLFMTGALCLHYNKLKADDTFIPAVIVTGLVWIGVSVWLSHRQANADRRRLEAQARQADSLRQNQIRRADQALQNRELASAAVLAQEQQERDRQNLQAHGGDRVHSLLRSKSDKIRINTGNGHGPVVYQDLSQACVICLDDLPDVVRIFPCGHGSCPKCQKEMFEAKHLCPMCRKPVTNLGFLVKRMFV